MWNSITIILTTLLPSLLKLILWIIEKQNDNTKLKEEFLKFIASLDTDLPIKLHDKYDEQLERIRKQLTESGK